MSSPVFAHSLSNHLLIAMPSLQDPHFAHSVTYICDHTAEGAMGIVINRPMDFCVRHVLQQLQLKPEGPLANEWVLAGGPVQTQRGFVLHGDGSQWESSLQVTPSISLTGSKDILAALAAGEGPSHALLALGYAGWSAGQLEQELANNAWLTVPASFQLVFETPIEQRWQAAAKHLGVDIQLISSQAGHA